MNSREWRYFLKVAELGNVTRAAAQLHLTQPALSRHLKQLEEEAGTPLLARHGRGVRLTAAGVHFRDVAREILGRLVSLQDELRASTDEPTGELAVGMPLSWSGLITSQLIPRFLRLYPRVRIHITEGTTMDLRRALKARQLHLAVLTEVERDSELTLAKLAVEGACMIGPKSAGLSPTKALDLKQVAKQPLIMLPHTTRIRYQLERVLAKARVDANTIIEVNTLLLMKFVEAGMGFTILPACAIAGSPAKDRLSYTNIQGFESHWGLATVKRRPRSAAVNAFEAETRALLRELIEGGKWPSARLTTEKGL
ncbi:MAG TPA: LysR family transcriptional regulator [Rubrivivax sp.]|nr:LysR family transcriptional regulator [Rubrivivax sp.]